MRRWLREVQTLSGNHKVPEPEYMWLIGQRGSTLVLTENRTGKLRAFESEDNAAFFIAGLPNPERYEPRMVEVEE